MKLLIKSKNRDKVLEVCEEISKIKDENKEEITKSSLKQKTARSVVGMASSLSGGANIDDVFESFVIIHEETEDGVLLNIPFYVPKMVRFLLKRKMRKSFEEIFKKSGVDDVSVDFISWGDEDLKDD